jgi:hypothetical protein
MVRKTGEDIECDKDKLQFFKDTLYNGNYLISFERIEPQSNVKEYRACYFAKIDRLRYEAGEGRYELHELVKEHVLSPMYEELPSLFYTEEGGASTKNLTLTGWSVLLERLDLWAFMEYNTILP